METRELTEGIAGFAIVEDLPVGKQTSLQQEQNDTEELIRWLKEHGTSFEKLVLRKYSDCDEYRGVHCCEAVAEDEVVLSVPLSLIMTTEVAKASVIGQSIIRSGVVLRSRHSYLAMMLLHERSKGKNSFWWPYINTLPKRYSNLPINFHPDELALLKGSFSLQNISIRRHSLKQEFASLCGCVKEACSFSLEDFAWARNVVITRVFGLVINGIKTEGLVPLADFLNHKRPRESKWTFDQDLGAFTIVSTVPMESGQAVSDSYGRKCNSRFFVNYGFALDDNEDNEAVLTIVFPTEDHLYPIKKALMGCQRETSVTRSFQMPADSRHCKFMQALSCCRIAAANNLDIRVLQRRSRASGDEVNPISHRNEMEALKLLREASLGALGLFESDSVEVDNKLLAGELTFNQRNCILMRRGEKQVCNWVIELVDAMIPLMKLPTSEFFKCVSKSTSSRFSAYVEDVVIPLFHQGLR